MATTKLASPKKASKKLIAHRQKAAAQKVLRKDSLILTRKIVTVFRVMRLCSKNNCSLILSIQLIRSRFRKRGFSKRNAAKSALPLDGLSKKPWATFSIYFS